MLNGNSLQTVTFESSGAKFAKIVLENGSIDGVNVNPTLQADSLVKNNTALHFGNGGIYGWTLSGNQVINDDVFLSGGTIDLAGYNLTINGNLTLNSGNIEPNGGTLTVTGDFKQTGGLLKMLTADDHLIIEGSFEENTMLDQTDTLKKGTIEVKGNFKRDKANARNFRSSPELKVLFSGTAGQIVDLNSCSNYGEGENYWINYNNNTGTNSVFGGLEITNTSAEGVSFVSPVYVSGKLYSVPDTVKTVNGSRNITLSPEAIIENNYWKYSLRYSQNKTLAEDMSIGGNLYIDNNTLNLAGKTLTVGGDFVMYHHTLNINSGTLDVKGDLRLQREIVANATAQPTEYGYADARFMMTNPNDKVKVGGDFYVQSYATAIADLTAGELRIAGDFNQLNPNSNSTANFYATGNHITVLNGNSLQTVTFESSGAKFAKIVLENGSIDGVNVNPTLQADSLVKNNTALHFGNGGIYGWTLSGNQVINDDVFLSGGTIDLAGYNLTINGNLTLNSGNIEPNGGTLTVTGDFKQTGGLLKMLTADDHLIIEGSFEENTMLDQTDTLKKGTIEVKGNFKRDKANARNFRSSPELKVLFSGTAGQIVDLNSCSNYGEGENYWINYNNNTGTNSVFGGLEITNTSAEGVSFVSPVYVSGKLYSVPDTVKTVNGSRNITLSPEAIIENNYWKYSLRYSQNKTLAEDMSIGGNLYIDNNTLNLAGKTLTVGGDFVMYHHTLNINSGTLDVKGDLRLQREIVANATAQPTEYGYADARFMMTNPNDKVKVGGDFYVQSYATAIADLTAGELRIAGDFNQLNPNSNSTANFYATGNHITVLNGNSLQTVTFESSGAKFNTLDIQNDTEVYIENILYANNIAGKTENLRYANNYSSGFTLTEDKEFDEFKLGGGTLDLDGHTLKIHGDFLQSGGVVILNGGTLEIDGDYRIENVNGTASSGSLKMTNGNDKLIVKNNFVTNSSIDHNNLLTNGIIEIYGNFSQKSANQKNFIATENHQTVFKGTKSQVINFENPTVSNFAKIKFDNQSPNGIEIATKVYATKSIQSEMTRITNSENIYVGKDAEIIGGNWNGNLTFYQDYTLNSELIINGDLYLTGGTFDLNERKLYVNGNAILSNGVFKLNNGSAFVKKDFRIQTQSNNGFGLSYAQLDMTKPNDYVRVDGDFFTQSNYNHNNLLTNGILEVKSNFNQINGSVLNFAASSNHKVVLNGIKMQYITFESATSEFNNFDISKPLETGYWFSRLNVSKNPPVRIDNDTEIPTAPQNLTVDSQNSFAIKLHWDASSDNVGIDGYNIYRDGKLVGYSVINEYTDAGLDSNSAYVYYVVAYDISRNYSNKSNYVEAKTDVDGDAPTIPQNLKLTKISSSEIKLSWDASIDSGRSIKEYRIYKNDIAI